MSSAVEAGVTILNEVGVDPGIDHMMAMQCFDEVKQNGGKVSVMDLLWVITICCVYVRYET